MRLISFYPQASDVGKAHRFAPTTVQALSNRVLKICDIRNEKLHFFCTTDFKRNFIKSSRHQTACFKVTAKSYNVATRTEPRPVKIVEYSQRRKASNAVLAT
jgi:hypothetical protein